MLPLDIDSLKLAVAAYELIPILVISDCDVIEPIKNVTTSEDFIWPIRTPNESIAFRMVIRLLFISVMGVIIQAGLGIGSEIGSEIGSGIGSGMILLNT
jgi:hypothetical protein